jgi:hypothetical protein
MVNEVTRLRVSVDPAADVWPGGESITAIATRTAPYTMRLGSFIPLFLSTRDDRNDDALTKRRSGTGVLQSSTVFAFVDSSFAARTSPELAR